MPRGTKMEILREAKSVVNFTLYYPLLNNATLDNDTPIPGYLYEKIIKLSHHSPGHRQQLLDFLLARLHTASWSGKQKVVRVLSQVCTRGHRGVRVLLRGRDGDLRRAAATGGPPDPLLANTPQLFLSSAIQELLTQLFDPNTMKEDEAWMAGQEDGVGGGKEPLKGQSGYGGGARGGRYQGFGSTPNTQPASLVTQVRGLVERVISPQSDGRRLATDLLSGGDKGDYQPLSLPSLSPSFSTPASPPSSLHPHIPVITASQCSKYRAHTKGKAGGGWESEDDDDDEVEDEDELPPLSPPYPQPPYHDLPLRVHGEESVAKEKGPEEGWGPEDEFLTTRIDPYSSWPVDHDALVSLCRDCSALNPERLLGKVGARLSGLSSLPMTTDFMQESVLFTTTDTSHSAAAPGVNTSSTSLTPADTPGTQQASFTPPTTSLTPNNTSTSSDTTHTSNIPSTLSSSLAPPLPSSTPAMPLHSLPTPSATSTKLLVLLLLVEFGLHYEVFPPAVVSSALGGVLEEVNKEGTEAAVRSKARKLSLIVARLL